MQRVKHINRSKSKTINMDTKSMVQQQAEASPHRTVKEHGAAAGRGKPTQNLARCHGRTLRDDVGRKSVILSDQPDTNAQLQCHKG